MANESLPYPIITRKQAKAIGQTWYFTGKPCKHGHIAKRWTSKGVCDACLKPAVKQFRESNKESLNAYRKEYQKRNRGRLREKATLRMKNWRTANPEKDKANAKRFRDRKSVQRAQNAKRWREVNRERFLFGLKDYRERNKAKRCALQMKRQAQKLRAVPAWVDESAIEALYIEASRLTKETGIKHEVDHIIPLQGKTVCGLHVPWNLRVVTQAENRSKHNKLIPAAINNQTTLED